MNKDEILKSMESILNDNAERIEELEAEVKEWKDKADLWCKTANLKDHNILINKELEKENARLRHINSTTLAKLNLDNGELITENGKLKKENAELKRNRWHNLRKNPQDLPKEDGAVLVVDMDYGHPGYKVALFWKKDGAFTGHYLAKLDVIAWREIPIFQEEA